MELNIQTPKTNGNGNGHLVKTRKSQSIKTGSLSETHHRIFDPMKYMLKLPKTKKVSLPNGQVRYDKTEADYLPVAARIAWFRIDNPYWSIIIEIEQLADKAVLMKATIKEMLGTDIATARKKKPKQAFRITSKKPRQEQVAGHWRCAGMERFKHQSLTKEKESPTLRSRGRQTKKVLRVVLWIFNHKATKKDLQNGIQRNIYNAEPKRDGTFFKLVGGQVRNLQKGNDLRLLQTTKCRPV